MEDFGLGKRSDLYVRLMGHPRRSLEDSSAESSVDHGGPDEEVSEGNNISNQLETILVLFWHKLLWLLSAQG